MRDSRIIAISGRSRGGTKGPLFLSVNFGPSHFPPPDLPLANLPPHPIPGCNASPLQLIPSIDRSVFDWPLKMIKLYLLDLVFIYSSLIIKKIIIQWLTMFFEKWPLLHLVMCSMDVQFKVRECDLTYSSFIMLSNLNKLESSILYCSKIVLNPDLFTQSSDQIFLLYYMVCFKSLITLCIHHVYNFLLITQYCQI